MGNKEGESQDRLEWAQVQTMLLRKGRIARIATCTNN